MRRFFSQGDFRAIFNARFTVSNANFEQGIDFKELELPARQVVCVEKIVVKAEVPLQIIGDNTTVDSTVNLESKNSKLKTYLLSEFEKKLIDGIVVDFNSSQSYKSLRGDALIQEFDSETYLTDIISASALLKFQNAVVPSSERFFSFQILLQGYKFALSEEVREKILKVDV